MSHARLASRAAAIALLLGLLLVPALMVLWPLGDAWTSERDAQAADRDALAGYRRVAAEGPLWEARIRQLEGDAASTAGLVKASPTPAATAALQSDVRQLVQASGGEIRTAQPGNAVPEKGLERIEAGFDLSLPAESLPGFVAAVDANDPYLFVDRLDLTAQTAQGKAPTLTIHLQVHAYRRPT
ncbi:MAG TPA: type II secretion system protein GspM [Stellaceae bacterium]|nr:type II secretion system protein GspM [Stellaceae bacterium]